jgi:hypothetical protein
MRMTLTHRARRIDSRVIVAKRLQRLWSIAQKLERNANMALSQMQDIGGCRAVLRTVGQVEKRARLYERSVARNPITLAFAARLGDDGGNGRYIYTSSYQDWRRKGRVAPVLLCRYRGVHRCNQSGPGFEARGCRSFFVGFGTCGTLFRAPAMRSIVPSRFVGGQCWPLRGSAPQHGR